MADYYNAATGKSWSWSGKSPLEQMQQMAKEISVASKSGDFKDDPATKIARDDALDALGLRSAISGGSVYSTGLRGAKEQYKNLGRMSELGMIDDIYAAVNELGVNEQQLEMVRRARMSPEATLAHLTAGVVRERRERRERMEREGQ
jgi:hypothetical protein